MQLVLTKIIRDARSVLIVCHKKPDGDTLGSGFAIWHLCKYYGVPADIVCDSPLPGPYAFLPDFAELNEQSSDRYDLVFALDCGDAERMGKFCDYAKSVLTVNIDHHKTNDYFAKINHVVPELSSTCEAIYDLLSVEGAFQNGAPEGLSGGQTPRQLRMSGGQTPRQPRIDAGVLQKIAYYLYVGISTDTGHFSHSNVTAKTFGVAADLTSTGFDVFRVSSDLYRSYSVGRMQLVARAIQSMRFFKEDSIGIITIMLKDFTETATEQAETEGIIDYAVSIGSVRVAVCITEQEVNRLYRVSMRSKGPDVSKVAAVFGGGGHTRASGCHIHGYYEDVVDKVVKAVNDYYE
ncbi:MAG: bifunctional oligoribonuclease/PAP phosphatase NrnA [Firmicutes bacterium]|nr:bifunctional oligoribonuclease/PAP phosphatase NrnA [Bacillota bacterium]